MTPATASTAPSPCGSTCTCARARSPRSRTTCAPGLGSDPKAIPPKYFYDARGSELFEQITALPEYYPTRVEQSILDAAGAEIIERVQTGRDRRAGPGLGTEDRRAPAARWWRAAAARATCRSTSRRARSSSARERLAAQYEGLEIHGLVGDFEHHLDRIPPAAGRRLIAFLGGTIGNLDEPERRRLLEALRRQLGPDDRLLVGTDLVKDRARLEAAYNDAAGVTAEFNRNLLHVINANLACRPRPGRGSSTSRSTTSTSAGSRCGCARARR